MNRAVLPDLGRALRALGEHGRCLVPEEATPGQLGEIGEDLDRARRLLAEADGPAPRTGCRAHPGGPVDPGRGAGCLLCNLRRPQPRAAPAVDGDAAEVPLPVVLRTIREEGRDAAIALFGARVVARALAAAGRLDLTSPAHQEPGSTEEEDSP